MVVEDRKEQSKEQKFILKSRDDLIVKMHKLVVLHLMSCLLSNDMLALLHCHVGQQLLQPGLPLVDSVEPQGGLRVQQGHCGVAVQLLQGTPQHPAALLQQGAQLRLQALALADEVGLAGVLQEGRGRDVARGAWRKHVHYGQQIKLFNQAMGSIRHNYSVHTWTLKVCVYACIVAGKIIEF